MKIKLLHFFIFLILGSVVWFISPLLNGRQEPWDSKTYIYICELLVIGFVLAFRQKHIFISLFGLYVGQALVMFFRPQHSQMQVPWWYGATFLLTFTSICFVGPLLVLLLSKLNKKSPST